MMMTVENTLLPGLERIRLRFLDMLVERLSDLERLCREMAKDDPQSNALRELQSIMHKIAGSAGTLGLQDLGDTARICENQIIDHLDTGTTVLPEIYQSLGEFAEKAEYLLCNQN